MYILFVLLILSATLTSAVPHPSIPRSLPNSKNLKSSGNTFAEKALAIAKQRGIDVTGPHPLDYKEKTKDYITFEENTDMAIWAAAQGARTDKAATKRDPQSGLNLSVWSRKDCNGHGAWIINVEYNSWYKDMNWYRLSMGLSRAVDQNVERIWLKTYASWPGSGLDYCAVDLKFYVYGDPGCAHDLPQYECLVLSSTKDRCC
ncbi:hypothetical protein BDD12DRAFT_885772 [Trichophaea hybrida]|nr:hypothetical protein BDD12DRAFT_885772 [Trichophaea hybrida]